MIEQLLKFEYYEPMTNQRYSPLVLHVITYIPESFNMAQINFTEYLTNS